MQKAINILFRKEKWDGGGGIKRYWVIYNTVNKHYRGHPLLKHTRFLVIKILPQEVFNSSGKNSFNTMTLYGGIFHTFSFMQICITFKVLYQPYWRVHVGYTCTLPHIIFTNLSKILMEIKGAVVWAWVFYLKPKQIWALSRQAYMLYINEQCLLYYSLV